MPVTHTVRVADPAREKTYHVMGTRTVELTDDLVDHCGLREPLLRLAEALAGRTKMSEVRIVSVDFTGSRIETMTPREIEEAEYRERVRAYDEARKERAGEV